MTRYAWQWLTPDRDGADKTATAELCVTSVCALHEASFLAVLRSARFPAVDSIMNVVFLVGAAVGIETTRTTSTACESRAEDGEYHEQQNASCLLDVAR